MKKLLFLLLSSTLLLTPLFQTIAFQKLTIYSGNCTLYKKSINGNQMKYTPLREGTGKVVIDRTGKTFNFYFNGKLILSKSGYDSYVDTQQGGEGFTFSSGYGEAGADAHRYTAERQFNINVGMVFGGDPGYSYEMTNYKLN